MDWDRMGLGGQIKDGKEGCGMGEGRRRHLSLDRI